jgi:hypothetical protein
VSLPEHQNEVNIALRLRRRIEAKRNEIRGSAGESKRNEVCALHDFVGVSERSEAPPENRIVRVGLLPENRSEVSTAALLENRNET